MFKIKLKKNLNKDENQNNKLRIFQIFFFRKFVQKIFCFHFLA